ncbi:unnamed protein product [Acanthoscelides obtectus]|uniref:Uncharacterized protein n=1 Tax=Acanthoscelides obtectus TaxID=200917 RepID=A0A9P0K717_ACAOB|nr:unnamed protein product [Acanthoscelides obtectus]CAK1666895.1 hypothetical protein AOBTE_LOCUS25541 [Acanthoscelides obtectus]
MSDEGNSHFENSVILKAFLNFSLVTPYIIGFRDEFTYMRYLDMNHNLQAPKFLNMFYRNVDITGL